MIRKLYGRLRPVDHDALKIWLASRVSIWVIAGSVGYMFATAGEGIVPLLDRWQQWDFDHYWGIALAGGYEGSPTGVPNEAFFPAFPASLWLGAELGVRHVVTGLVVSLVAGAVAAVALGRLGDLEGGRMVGRYAVLVWVLAPSAVFLAAPYTEALFLAFAFPAWLAARRGHWLAAGVLTALSCTVRVSGVFLVAALVVQWLATRRVSAGDTDDLETSRVGTSSPLSRDRYEEGDHETTLAGAAAQMSHDRHANGRWSWSGFGWLFLPAIPLLAWSVYLKSETGDWLAWMTAQAEGWDRHFTLPWDSFANTWSAAFGGTQSPEFAWMFRAEIVAMIVGAALTIALMVWKRWGEATWIGLQVVAFGTSTWYFSVPRATLLWWPLWIGIAALAVRRRWVLWAYLSVSVPLMVVWATAFLTGRWAG
ncbi:MAG: mannosyltransferase family protein [Jiangellaceae bacterium]